MLSLDDVKRSVPPTLRGAVDQPFVDQLNAASVDPIVAEDIRNNFINYTKVLTEGRYKLTDYLNAVTYVSYKVMGKTNEESYSLTFPQRYNTLMAKGTSKKDISSYVAMYHKNKLVNLILQQTLTPIWLLNIHNFQKAINKQVDLMENAQSEKVQCEAADSLLRHLAAPEVKEVSLKIGLEENSGMKELESQMAALATRQQELIGLGMPTKDIAALPLIEGECVAVS